MVDTQDYDYFSRELASKLKTAQANMISEFFGPLNELVKHNMASEEE